MIAQDEVQSWTLVNKIKKKPSGFTKYINLNSLATTGFSKKELCPSQLSGCFVKFA